MQAAAAPLIGQSMPRVEDAALLSGRGRFIDDLGIAPGTLHAAILRSPRAHAEISHIDVAKALSLPGVAAVLTGQDIAAVSAPMVAGLKIPVENWPIAIDRVRYAGEPIAVALAESRALAEDALDLIEVGFRDLPAVVDPLRSLLPEAAILHQALGSNLASDRRFRYGDPEAAFSAADHVVSIAVGYPRNGGMPMETFGIIAEYDPHADAYDILSNFQGPFSLHAVMARALRVSGNRLRLRIPPDSGGSFGVKQGVAPYAILIAAAARLSGRPVKWIEDRLEHLIAGNAATNRVIHLKAAVTGAGVVTALDWDQIEDIGAYARAPEPATLYRMHGNMTGAYAIRNLAIRNRVVMTNKTPTGLVRGFGGPQVYFALERLMQRIALHLRIDHAEIIRRNLIATQAFPYRTASGALYDSGDYTGAVDMALGEGRLADLRARQAAARAEGRLYGIGLAAIVEPSVSNMGYITTVLTHEERTKAGPKNGAQATATVSIDPLGTVSVQVASTPQGQGHRTVIAQVVAAALGLDPRDVRVVTELDTAKDAWSIASGNYSSRFAAAVAGAAHLAATRLADRLKQLAASQFGAEPAAIRIENGAYLAAGTSQRAIPFARLAALAHWSPALLPEGVGQTMRETAFWTPPELDAPTAADEINSSLCHGFVFDLAGVEVDRTTGAVRVDRYISMHDCGTILHPAMVEGQIRGGFAQAFGATFLEELAYDEDGTFRTGTFADYLLPTAMETPDIEILHIATPSPFTPLGAKGVGEGNCMSTPVCLANAVADALGVADVTLPLKPSDMAARLAGDEPRPPADAPARAAPMPGGRALSGAGEAIVPAPPEAVWAMLLDADVLAGIIPGCHNLRKVSPTRFTADVTLGVGPVRGRYDADIALSDLVQPQSATLSGRLSGSLGAAEGTGHLTLEPTAGGVRVRYRYEAQIGGKAAAIGGRLLDGAARVVIGQFFAALARRAAPQPRGFLARWFGGGS